MAQSGKIMKSALKCTFHYLHILPLDGWFVLSFEFGATVLGPMLEIACVASVLVRGERNSGRAKEFFTIGPREKLGESKKGGRKGVGERKEGNACPQTPRF